MPRLMPAGLQESLGPIDQQTESHGTLELTINTDVGVRVFHLATSTLSFNGVDWGPDLRDTGEITGNLTGDADEATLEIQNADAVFGIQLVANEKYLSNAEAVVGRYWKNLEHGSEGHKVLLTGLVTNFKPNELAVQLLVVPDTYSGVSVGPFRHNRRACQAGYKTPECGRPITDPFNTCDYTLDGSGGCHGRWGAVEKLVRFIGVPYLPSDVFQKII